MNKSWNWFYERCNHPSGDRDCSVHEIRVKGGGGGEIIPGLSHNPPLYFFLSFSLRKSFSNIFKFFIHSFILSFILSLLSLSQFYFSFSLSVLSTFLLLYLQQKSIFGIEAPLQITFLYRKFLFWLGAWGLFLAQKGLRSWEIYGIVLLQPYFFQNSLTFW